MDEVALARLVAGGPGVHDEGLAGEVAALRAELAVAHERIELMHAELGHARRPGTPARIDDKAAEMVCRAAALAAAGDELAWTGVAVALPPGFLPRLAARLEAPVESVAALWPSAAAMEAEILLAQATEGLTARADDASLIAIWTEVGRRAHLLGDPEGRRILRNEVVARLTVEVFANLTVSLPWRNYVACASAASRAPGLAAELRRRLSEAEEAFATRMGEFYRNILPLIGYRLSPILRGDHRAFAATLTAAMEGFGVVRQTLGTVLGADYGTPGTPPVGIETVAAQALLDSLLEPDPDFDAPAARTRLTDGLVLEPTVL